jgi:hypothetical protein
MPVISNSAIDYWDARKVIDHSPWFAITCLGPEGPHTESGWTRDLLALSSDRTRLRIPLRSISPAWLNLQQDPRVQLVFVAESLVRAGGWGQELSVTGIASLEPPEKKGSMGASIPSLGERCRGSEGVGLSTCVLRSVIPDDRMQDGCENCPGSLNHPQANVRNSSGIQPPVSCFEVFEVPLDGARSGR